MSENETINKHIRHESAKKKYENYQRSLSCKNIMPKAQLKMFIPIPGEYAVIKSKPNRYSVKKHTITKSTTEANLPKLKDTSSISLTKNLKEIIEGRDASPVKDIMHQMANKNSTLREKKGILFRNNDKQKLKIRQKQNPSFKRPISAKIYNEMDNLQDSTIIYQGLNQSNKQINKKPKKINEMGRKLMIPKHIYGYKTVKLPQFKSKIINTQQSHFSKDFQSEENNNNATLSHLERRFLPVEYYLEEYHAIKKDNESQEVMLMNKYKNKIDEKVHAYSRWFNTDGSVVWRKCLVQGYDKTEERWLIRWIKLKEGHRQKQGDLQGEGVKKVSRNNLCFEGQDFTKFEEMVQKADSLRKKSQLFLKYNTLINLIESSTPQFSALTQSKIRKLVGLFQKQSYDEELLTQLINEVKQSYTRSCHKFEFDMALPYSKAHKKVFEGVLPQQIFDVNPRKAMNPEFMDKITEQWQIKKMKKLSSKNSRALFHKGMKKIEQKSHLCSLKKIEILKKVNIMRQNLLNNSPSVQILKDYYYKDCISSNKQCKSYGLKQLSTLLSRNIESHVFNLRHTICDIEHLASKQFDPTYQNKKLIPKDQYGQLIEQYTQFCKVVNYRIEDILKQSCSQTIKKIARIVNPIQYIQCPEILQRLKSDSEVSEHLLDDILRIPFVPNPNKISIEIKIAMEEGNRAAIIPSFSEYRQLFLKGMKTMVAQISGIKCISKSYLPEIRPDNTLNLDFKGNFQEKNSQLDMISMSLVQLNASFDALNSVFQSYMSVINKKISQFNKIQSEFTKKIVHKKISDKNIEQIVTRVLTLKEETHNILKFDQFNLGPSILKINIRQLKNEMLIKINQLIRSLVQNLIIDRIIKENQKIQKSIQKYQQVMRKVPQTAQQFIDLENYIKTTVALELEKAIKRFSQFQFRISLIDQMQIRDLLTSADFDSIHRLYLKILKISELKDRTLATIDQEYRKNFIQSFMEQRDKINSTINGYQLILEQCFTHKTIQQMDNGFQTYIQLNNGIHSIEEECNKLIKEEILLKLKDDEADSKSKSIQEILAEDFPQIRSLQTEFQYPYSLISLSKNYKLGMMPILDENLAQSQNNIISEDSEKLETTISNNIKKLKSLLKILTSSQSTQVQLKIKKRWKIEVSEVTLLLSNYQNFYRYLSVIEVFRSTNLRQRHWNRIQKIVNEAEMTYNLNQENKQNNKVQFAKIKNRKIKEVLNIIFNRDGQIARQIQENLIKVSTIATKELSFEKTFNNLKREWKESKIFVEHKIFRQKPLRNIQNIQKLHTKLEEDSITLQQILESPFVTFLQSQIRTWKQSVLDQIQIFFQEWPEIFCRVQRLIQFQQTQIFGYIKNNEQLKNIESQDSQGDCGQSLIVQLENTQKQYNSLMTTIQFQPSLSQIIGNTRLWDFFEAINKATQGVQKKLQTIFQSIKSQNIKIFGLFPNIFALSNLQVVSNESSDNKSITKIIGLQHCWNIAEFRLQLNDTFSENEKSLQLKAQVTTTLNQTIDFKLNLSKCLDLENKQLKCSQLIMNNIDHFCKEVNRQIIKNNKQKISKQILYQSDEQFSYQLNIAEKSLAQNILLLFRFRFVKNIENILGDLDPFTSAIQASTMQEQLKKEVHRLQKIKIQLIRMMYKSEDRKQVKKIQILKYSQLIMEISNEIAISEQMIHKQIVSSKDFNWEKQFRYYQEHENSDLIVSVLNYNYPYTYQIVNPMQIEPYYPENYQKCLIKILLPLITGNCINLPTISQNLHYYEYIGAIFGRTLTQIWGMKIENVYNTNIISNLIQLAASGMMMIIRGIELLGQSKRKLLHQQLQSIYIQTKLLQVHENQQKNLYETTINPKKMITVKDLNGKSISLNPHCFWIAFTCFDQIPNNNEKNKDKFRQISVRSFDPLILLKSELSCLGINNQQVQEIANSIEIIFNQLSCRQKEQKLSWFDNVSACTPIIRFSPVQIIGRLMNSIKQKMSQQVADLNSEKICSYIQLSIKDIVLHLFNRNNGSMVDTELWATLQKLRKSQKIQKKLRKINFEDSPQIDDSFEQLKDSLINHLGVILYGPELSGKSTIIQALNDYNNGKEYFIVKSFNPLAYFDKELYQMGKQGLMGDIIEEIMIDLCNKKAQLSSKESIVDVYGVLHLNCGACLRQIEWIRHYLQLQRPQICQKVKILIESSSLQHYHKSQLEGIGIIRMGNKLSWTHIYHESFNKYLGHFYSKNSSEEYRLLSKTGFQLIQPIFDFYNSVLQSVQKDNPQNSHQRQNKNVRVNKNVIAVPTVCLLNNTLQLCSRNYSQYLDIIKSEGSQQQLNQQGVMLNLLIQSLLINVGNCLSEQLKRTLSRHFRFIMQQIDPEIARKSLITQGSDFSTKDTRNIRESESFQLQKFWTLSQIYENFRKENNIYEYYYCAKKNRWIRFIPKQCTQKMRSVNIQFAEYTAFRHYLVKFIENKIPVFLIGEPHTSRDYLFRSVLPQSENSLALSNQLQQNISYFPKNKFKCFDFFCTKFTNKGPIFTRILELMKTYGYSSKLKGIANYSTNLIYLDDLHIGDKKNNTASGSLEQFISQFLANHGWHFSHQLQSLVSRKSCFKTISNLQFYGNITIRQSGAKQCVLPERICKKIIPILVPLPEKRIETILRHNLSGIGLITTEVQMLISCTQNIYQALERDSRCIEEEINQKAIKGQIINYDVRDMILVTESLAKILNNTKKDQLRQNIKSMGGLLKIWAYTATKVFNNKSEILAQKEALFYFINNTLMEEQRVRYKQIAQSQDYHIIRMPSSNQNHYAHYTLDSFISNLISTLTAQQNISNKFLFLYHHSYQGSYQVCKKFLFLMLKFMEATDIGLNQHRIVFICNKRKQKINPVIKAVSLITHGRNSSVSTLSTSQPVHSEFKKEWELENSWRSSKYIGFIENIQQQWKKCSKCEIRLKELISNHQNYNESSSNTEQLPWFLTIPQTQNYIAQNAKGHKNCRNNFLEEIFAYQRIGLIPSWAEQNFQQTQFYKKSDKQCKIDQVVINSEKKLSTHNLYIILNFQTTPLKLIEQYKSLANLSIFIFLNDDFSMDNSCFNQPVRTLQKNDQEQHRFMTDIKEIDDNQEEKELLTCKISKNFIIEESHWINIINQQFQFRANNHPLLGSSHIHSIHSSFNSLLTSIKQSATIDNRLYSTASKVVNSQIKEFRSSLQKLIQVLRIEINALTKEINENNMTLQIMKPIFMQQSQAYKELIQEVERLQSELNNFQHDYKETINPYKQNLKDKVSMFCQTIQNQQRISQVIKYLSAMSILKNQQIYPKKMIEILAILCTLEVEKKNSVQNRGKSVPSKPKKEIKKNQSFSTIARVMCKEIGDVKFIKKIQRTVTNEGLSVKVIDSINSLMQQIKYEQQKIQEKNAGRMQKNLHKYVIQFLEAIEILAGNIINFQKRKEQLSELEKKIEITKAGLQKKRKQKKKIQMLKQIKDNKQSKSNKILHEQSEEEVKKANIMSNYKNISQFFTAYHSLAQLKQDNISKLSWIQKDLSFMHKIRDKVQSFINHTVEPINLLLNNFYQTDGGNDEKINLEYHTMQMVIAIYYFSSLISLPNPMAKVRKILSFLNSQSQPKFKINESDQYKPDTKSYAEWNNLLKNALKNYTGCILLKNFQNQRNSGVQIQDEIITKTILEGNFERMNSEELIIRAFSEEQSRKQHPIQDYCQSKLDQYLKSNSEDRKLKHQKYFEAQKNMIQTLMQIQKKGKNLQEQSNTNFEKKKPLIITIAKGQMFESIFAKIISIIEIYGDNYILTNKKLFQGINSDPLLLKNRLIIISAASFSSEAMSQYPYWQIDGKLIQQQTKFTWKECQLDFLHFKKVQNIAKEVIQNSFVNVTKESIDHQIVNEQKNKKNMSQQILRKTANILFNLTELTAQLNKICNEDKKQQYKIHCNKELMILGDEINEISVLSQPIQKNQQQAENIQNDYKITEAQTQEDKIIFKQFQLSLIIFKTFKIVQTLSSQSEYFSITFNQYCQEIIKPFLSIFLSSNKIKNTKNVSNIHGSFQHNLSELLQGLKTILYYKFQSILNLNQKSEELILLLKVGICSIQENQSSMTLQPLAQIHKTRAFIVIFKLCIKALNSRICQSLKCKKIIDLHKIYSELYLQTPCQVQNSDIIYKQQQLFDKLHTQIKRFILQNQYLPTPKNQSISPLQYSIPKIVLIYLVILLQQKNLPKCLIQMSGNIYRHKQKINSFLKYDHWAYFHPSSKILLLNSHNIEIDIEHLTSYMKARGVRAKILPTNLIPPLQEEQFLHKSIQNKSENKIIYQNLNNLRSNEPKQIHKKIQNIIQESVLKSQLLIAMHCSLDRDIGLVTQQYEQKTQQRLNQDALNIECEIQKQKNKEKQFNSSQTKLVLILDKKQISNKIAKKLNYRFTVLSQTKYCRQRLKHLCYDSLSFESQFFKPNKCKFQELQLLNPRYANELKKIIHFISEMTHKYWMIIARFDQTNSEKFLTFIIRLEQFFKKILFMFWRNSKHSQENKNNNGPKKCSTYEQIRHENISKWKNELQLIILSFQINFDTILASRFLLQRCRIFIRLLNSQQVEYKNVRCEALIEQRFQFLYQKFIKNGQKYYKKELQMRSMHQNQYNLIKLLKKGLSNRLIQNICNNLESNLTRQSKFQLISLEEIIYLKKRWLAIVNMVPLSQVFARLTVSFNCYLSLNQKFEKQCVECTYLDEGSPYQVFLHPIQIQLSSFSQLISMKSKFNWQCQTLLLEPILSITCYSSQEKQELQKNNRDEIYIIDKKTNSKYRAVLNNIQFNSSEKTANFQPLIRKLFTCQNFTNPDLFLQFQQVSIQICQGYPTAQQINK